MESLLAVHCYIDEARTTNLLVPHPWPTTRDNLWTHCDENESVINQSGTDDENESCSATVDKSSEQEKEKIHLLLAGN